MHFLLTTHGCKHFQAFSHTQFLNLRIDFGRIYPCLQPRTCLETHPAPPKHTTAVSAKNFPWSASASQELSSTTRIINSSAATGQFQTFFLSEGQDVLILELCRNFVSIGLSSDNGRFSPCKVRISIHQLSIRVNVVNRTMTSHGQFCNGSHNDTAATTNTNATRNHVFPWTTGPAWLVQQALFMLDNTC